MDNLPNIVIDKTFKYSSLNTKIYKFTSTSIMDKFITNN